MATADGALDGRFLGHPKGLAYLTLAVSWERFAFYGMQSLLVLYMTRSLLLPGHAGHVWGLGGLERWIRSVYGPLSVGAMASALFGLFAGGVYLTPILGGLIADRWLGRTRTVSAGAALIAAGHVLMGFEAAFLPALACILLGVGMFKSNVADQVGRLYPANSVQRGDAFQIYYTGVSAAVIVAPLICGTLGERVAWRWGFLAAGGAMLIALATYLRGRRWLAPEPRARDHLRTTRARLQPTERRAVLVLLALLPALTLSTLANQEIFNAYLVWGQAHYRLELMGRVLPVTWLISLDSLAAVLALIGSVAFWRWWARHRGAASEITKLALGASLSAVGPLVLAAAAAHEAKTGGKIGLGWALAFHALNNLGFANLFAMGLALFARVAPRSRAGLMLALFYLHLFAANTLVGWLGGLLEAMPAASFWSLHAALVGGGAAALWLARWLFRDTLRADRQRPHHPNG